MVRIMAPSPRFFVVRPGTKRYTADGSVHGIPGAIVPLVAVDDLPEWLDIAGVPRELPVEHTIGLCNLGTVSKSKGAYAVKIIHEATPAARRQSAAANGPEGKGQGIDANGPLLSATPSSNTRNIAPAAGPYTAVHPADHMKAHWTEAAARTQHQGGGISNSMHNPHGQQLFRSQTPVTPAQLTPSSTPTPTPATPATGPATTAPNTTPTDTAPNSNPAINDTIPTTTTSNNTNPAPEYCRHWCHHGTCKWGLNCRYLHAMPTTPAELAEVGLCEIPSWWDATANGLLLAPEHLYGQGYHHYNPRQQQQQQHGHANGLGHGHGSGYSRNHPGMRLGFGSGQGHHHHEFGRHGLGRGHKQFLKSGRVSMRDLVPGAGASADVLTKGGAIGPGPMGVSGAGEFQFDPRDVRGGGVGHPVQLPPYAYTLLGGGGGSGGGNRGLSKRAMKALMRDNVVLLRELGSAVDAVAEHRKVRKGETDPLERGRGGRGAGREAIVKAARVELAAASAASAAGAGVSMGPSAGVVAGRRGRQAEVVGVRRVVATATTGKGIDQGGLIRDVRAERADAAGAGAGDDIGQAVAAGKVAEEMAERGKATELTDPLPMAAQMTRLVDV